MFVDTRPRCRAALAPSHCCQVPPRRSLQFHFAAAQSPILAWWPVACRSCWDSSVRSAWHARHDRAALLAPGCSSPSGRWQDTARTADRASGRSHCGMDGTCRRNVCGATKSLDNGLIIFYRKLFWSTFPRPEHSSNSESELSQLKIKTMEIRNKKKCFFPFRLRFSEFALQFSSSLAVAIFNFQRSVGQTAVGYAWLHWIPFPDGSNLAHSSW